MKYANLLVIFLSISKKNSTFAQKNMNNMHKISLLFVFFLASTLLFAQSVITSPTGFSGNIGFQAEGMSPNYEYVAGINQLTQEPSIWVPATGEVKSYTYSQVIYDYKPTYGTTTAWMYRYDKSTWDPVTNYYPKVDSVEVTVTDYSNILGYDTVVIYPDDYVGSFHAVSNTGLAVGEFGSSLYSTEKYPVMADVAADTLVYLYANRETENGGSAYAISSDNSVIVGFYKYNEIMTQPCYWTDNGQVRHDLPLPTEQAFGGKIDYVEARWMSADASVILGFVTESVNGRQVMIYWSREASGEYAVHAEYAKQYFTPYVYLENGTVGMGTNPYFRFEPNAISPNGRWVSLILMPKYDPLDMNAPELIQAARLDLIRREMEVLMYDGDMAPSFIGIADDGTAVGSHTLLELAENGRDGYVWPSDKNCIYSMQQLFPDEPTFAYGEERGETKMCGISADATTVLGYTNTTDGVDSWMVSSFIATLPTEWPAALEDVERVGNKAEKILIDGKVVIIRDDEQYNVLGVKLN